MPSSLNAMLAAWAISLIIVLGGIMSFELAYDPAEHAGQQPADEMEAATAEGHESVPFGESTGHEAMQPAAHEDEPEDHSTMMAEEGHEGSGDIAMVTDMPSAAEADMPAPGEDTAQAMQAEAQTGPVSLSDYQRPPVQARAELLEQSNQGPLPVVGPDGLRPFEAYSGRQPAPGGKRIAIIVTDLGQLARNTRRALSELPSEVTFAFSPYSLNLIDWGERSRELGHEVLLMIPMEPVNYPQNDPGALTLLTSLSAKENINLLRSSLGRLTGYVGVINHMGSRFTAASDSMRPVLDEIARRGLMFVDSRSSRYSRAATMAAALAIPTAYNNSYLDDEVSAEAIAKQLEDLENRANTLGSAVGLGRPYPVTIEVINDWAKTLKSRGFELVPISAVAGLQPPIR